MPPAPGARRAAENAQAKDGVENAEAASFFGSFLQKNLSGHAQSASGDVATPGLEDSPPSSLSPPSSPETNDETPANPTSPKESIGDFGQHNDDVENDNIEREDTIECGEENTHLESQGEKIEQGAINTETNERPEATGETNEKHKMEINVKAEAKMAEAPAAKSGPNDNDKEDKTKTEMSETATRADAKDVKKAQKNDETDSSPARKIAKDKQMTRARVKLENNKIETNTMDDDNATEISRNTEDSEAKNAVKTEANDPGVFEADMEQTTQVNEDSKATSKAASDLPKGFANDTDAKVDEEAQLPVKPETIERKVHVKTETNGSETNLDAENNDTNDTGTNARVEGDEAMEAVTKGLTKSLAEKCAGNQQVAQVNVKSETTEAKIDVKAIGNVDGAQVLVKPEAVKREDTPVSKRTGGNRNTHVNVKAKTQKTRTLGDDSDSEDDERSRVNGKFAPKHIRTTHVRSRHSTAAGVASTSSTSSAIVKESIDQGRKPSPNRKRRKTITTQLSRPTRARKRRPVAEDLHSDDIIDRRASTRVLRPRQSTSKMTVASAGSDSGSEFLDSSGDDETFQPEPPAEFDVQSAASEMLDSSDEDELLQPIRRAKSNRQRVTSEALDSSDEEEESRPEQRAKRGRREIRDKDQPVVLLKVCCVPECKRKAGTKNRCAKHGGQRRCEEEGCPKQASFGGKCKSHGGGRRCKEPGCSSSAQGKMMLCIAHGGGDRCQAPECSSSARGKTKFCVAHGGGRRCQKPTCKKAAAGSTRFCILHGGGRRCQADACTSSAQGATDFCVYHGGGRRCEARACPNSAAGSTTFCKSHNRSLRWQTAAASSSANLGEA